MNNSIIQTQTSTIILPNQYDFLKKPTEKKIKTMNLSKIYTFNNNKSKADRTFNCGHYMEFIYNGNVRKLKMGNFCKARLCPMCNWRLFLKRCSNLLLVHNELKSNYNHQLLFLTLTVRNCSGEDLRSTIKNILGAWRKMSHKNSIFKKSIQGWFRKLEVTYNKQENTYHPHLHIVLAVKPYYFKTDYYITQQKWVDMWKSELKIDYAPMIDIRREYGESTLVSELCKYATKDTDYIISDDIKLSASIVDVLDRAFLMVRFIAYGGILKSIYEQLKIDESNYADTIIDKDLNSIIEHYKWNNGYKQYQLFNPHQTINSN